MLSLPGVGGNTLQYTLTWKKLHVLLGYSSESQMPYNGNSNCGNQTIQTPYLFGTFASTEHACGPLFNPNVLAEITLPNGQKYTFEYNTYGEITKVKLPTGGYYRYSYAQVASLDFNNYNPLYGQGNRPDSANVATQYDGDKVLVTDPTGKKRLSQTDALGRLLRVWEVTPSDTWTVSVSFNGVNYTAYQTDYLYDALDNLRKVTQGSQARWFGYDSLSRLLRVKNRETATNTSLPSFVDPVTNGGGWSTAYVYDLNGNLTEKIDARNIKVSYTYDALNRNIKVDYDNTTVNPDITRVYDNATAGANGKGRFYYDYAGGNFGTGLNVEHKAVDSYDALGRPLSVRQAFKLNGNWSGNFTTAQTYDLAGHVKTMTYPSGRLVNYSYSAAGRLTSFTGKLGGLTGAGGAVTIAAGRC